MLVWMIWMVSLTGLIASVRTLVQWTKQRFSRNRLNSVELSTYDGTMVRASLFYAESMAAAWRAGIQCHLMPVSDCHRCSAPRYGDSSSCRPPWDRRQPFRNRALYSDSNNIFRHGRVRAARKWLVTYNSP